MTPEEAKQIPAIVPLEFWKDYEPKRNKEGHEIPGEFREVIKVRWTKKGMQNGHETTDKVDRLMRDGLTDKAGNPTVWAVIQPHYEAWKKGEDSPVNGTPIDALPFITKPLAKILRTFHIHSAEDFAETPDHALQRINAPGLIGARAKARTFLEVKKNEALIVEKTAGLQAKNEAMEAELKELRETVAQLTASLPKRARPKDVASEEAA